MVRKLTYAQKKILKKTDLLSWPELDNNLHELKVMKKFYVQKREDYTKYNKLSREIRDIARKIKDLDPKSPFRIDATASLLEKLHKMGIIPTKQSLELCDKVNASSFCRRRLPCLLVRNHMAENLKAAISFIEQGHVRVGPELVTDPAFLVTRRMEDFVTWAHASKIRKHVMEYNEMRDDFDMAA